MFIAASVLLAGCEGPPVQRQFKLVEKWSSRWCADATHERLDGCKTSDGINKLAGAVGALGQGDGTPPFKMDRATATQTCLAADEYAIWNLNQLLSEGATVVARGEQMYRYTARTESRSGEKDYYAITCHYRHVILEGRESVLVSGRQ